MSKSKAPLYRIPKYRSPLRRFLTALMLEVISAVAVIACMALAYLIISAFV